jgi:hypothetical protein
VADQQIGFLCSDNRFGRGAPSGHPAGDFAGGRSLNLLLLASVSQPHVAYLGEFLERAVIPTSLVIPKTSRYPT